MVKYSKLTTLVVYKKLCQHFRDQRNGKLWSMTLIEVFEDWEWDHGMAKVHFIKNYWTSNVFELIKSHTYALWVSIWCYFDMPNIYLSNLNIII